MIVVDASAMIEMLLRTPTGEAAIDRVLRSAETLHAPHLLDVEVAQVVRRYVAAGEIAPERGAAALDDLAAFPLHRYPHDMLLRRIFELRHNLTAYDAAYVALAEVLAAPLLTRDRRLAVAPGHRARIELA